jgi:hypothetical protein
VENGADGNFDSFHRNSVCFAERKTLGIPLSSSAEDKKARNSVPKHFVEKKNTRNFHSEPFHRREKHLEFRSEPLTLFETPSEPFKDKQDTLRERRTFFRIITETISSQFRGIFSERNFNGNPSPGTFRLLYGITLLEKYA